jgi:hypothetical protein
MTMSKQELVEADCWFTADLADSARMTAFKREARWRQHQWAVKRLGITEFGHHRVGGTGTGGRDVRNGTKLPASVAETGANFLGESILATVDDRLAHAQPHQTLDATRLRGDLLSSMPMAFNLFGEAADASAVQARSALATNLGLPAESAVQSSVVFEWSPGRRDPDYTRDRTAFDVVLRLDPVSGPPIVAGIETKYHEHCSREASPKSPAAAKRHSEQTNFLVGLAEASGVFRPGWHDAVLTTGLRQIWRDHLLALSMRQHTRRWDARSCYVLIHPGRNVSFSEAAKTYRELLVDGDTSFLSRSLEDMLEPAFPAGSTTRQQFAERYLW